VTAWLRRVLLASVVGYVVWWMYRGGAVDSNLADRAQVAGALLTAAALLWPEVVALRLKSTPPVPGPGELSAAEEYLARETLRYWREQAHRRRITTPAPVRLSWTWADAKVAPPPEDLVRSGRLLTQGEVTDLAERLYRRLPRSRRRLVLLGGAGVGKTGAMLLLLIHLLEARAPGEPVPVWLTLGSWNPEQTDLDAWVAQRMVETFRSLAGPAYGGPGSAAELVRTGRVALFLDGLDEMPEALRAKALEAVDARAGDLPVVLTSRRDEYAAAREHGRLHGAGVVEVLPMDLSRDSDADRAAEFLLAEQVSPHRELWQEVIDQLRANPGSVAGQTFTTALTLSLARDTFTTGDPREMLNEKAFPTSKTLRRHLLARVLEQAYPDLRQRKHAVHWLTWIAHHLHGQRDIAWWDINEWTHPAPFKLGLLVVSVVGLVGGLLVGLAVGLVGGPALGSGLAFGLLLGMMAEIVAEGWLSESRPLALHIRWPTCSEWRLLLLTGLKLVLQLMLGVMLMVGLTVGLQLMLMLISAVGVEVSLGAGLEAWSWVRLVWVLMGSFMVVLMGELVVGLVGAWQRLAAESAAVSPMAAYRADRSRTAALGLLGGSAAGLVGGLLGGSVGGSAAGLVGGLLGGLLGGLVVGNGAALHLLRCEWRLWLSGAGRVRFMDLLETASSEQVLRQVGPVYQFRHAALQEYLAGSSEEVPWV
jgi:hypothetical protein